MITIIMTLISLLIMTGIAAVLTQLVRLLTRRYARIQKNGVGPSISLEQTGGRRTMGCRKKIEPDKSIFPSADTHIAESHRSVFAAPFLNRVFSLSAAGNEASLSSKGAMEQKPLYEADFCKAPINPDSSVSNIALAQIPGYNI